MTAQLRIPVASQFASEASHWLPDVTVPQSAWLEHAPFAFWLVGALAPRTIVEIGVHHGFSYFAMCQSVQRHGLDTRCYGIDGWLGDSHAGYYGDEVYEEVCSHNRAFGRFSRLIRSDFTEASEMFRDGTIDLLHIDGFHTYEAVRHDFETWLPKMSDRGVVLFHDIAEFENGFGVYRLWDELRERYPNFAFMHGHGLGVLGVGRRIPFAVVDLFQASANADLTRVVQRTYERLGILMTSRIEILARDRQISALTQQVMRLEAVAEGYEASTSWRVTAPLRKLASVARSANGVTEEIGATLRKAREREDGYVPQNTAARLT